MRDISDLRQRQALPLGAKVLMSQNRIREWYEHFDGDVCVSFSGGKDSTVLAHLVRDLYPDVPLVFSNTGLEYPEIQAFAKKMGAEFVRPKMMFSEVVSKYGYPIISKEVSESIYYARRIRNGEITSKECVMRRSDLTGQRAEFDKNVRNIDYRFVKDECAIKRAELNGKYVGGSREDTYEQLKKEATAWEDWRRKGLQGIDQYKTGSKFNKTKWLPLSKNTQFNISHYCCTVMKKSPLSIYQRKTGRKPFLGTLAEESRMREQAWIKNGCNAYEGKKKISQPMSFWTEQDVLKYIKNEEIEIASVYGEIVGVDKEGFKYEPLPGCECKLQCTGCQRTGCIFCGFGIHLDKEPRFIRIAKTHPKQYEYCMNGGQWVDNPDYDPAAPKMDGDWENWNPKKIWVPSKKGLGMKKVFDDCNQIYGKDFIRYE